MFLPISCIRWLCSVHFRIAKYSTREPYTDTAAMPMLSNENAPPTSRLPNRIMPAKNQHTSKHSHNTCNPQWHHRCELLRKHTASTAHHMPQKCQNARVKCFGLSYARIYLKIFLKVYFRSDQGC